MKLSDLSRWNLGKAVPFTRSATQESKDTNKTNSMDPPSDEEDSEADDDIMVELGKKHDKKKTREANRKIAKSHWRAIILRRSFEIKVAMCILLFLVILLSSLLALYNNFGSDTDESTTVTDYKKVKPTNDWYQTPTAPISSPTSNNIGGAAGENADSSSSISLIEATLKDALGEDLLQDRLSSVGRAYRWITQEDDLHIVQTPTGIVQRFALAVFYFATGGLRTTSTWKYCSAVPTDVSNDHESFSSRCVMDEGDETVLCASPDAFVQCREYYDGDSTPLFPKRRWLSPVSECEWYGVTCNDDDVVERLEMPENGLMGRLPPQLEFLSGMKTIGLANNNLAGSVSIPGEWSLIENIDLSLNMMDIEFTSTAGGSASRLNTLKLRGNTISLEFPPEIVSFERLVSLDLSDTELMGTLPDSIDRLLLLSKYKNTPLAILPLNFFLMNISIVCRSRAESGEQFLEWGHPRQPLEDDKFGDTSFGVQFFL